MSALSYTANSDKEQVILKYTMSAPAQETPG